jgi:hypothetical protein
MLCRVPKALNLKCGILDWQFPSSTSEVQSSVRHRSTDFYYVLNKRLMNDTFYTRQLGIQYYNTTKLKISLGMSLQHSNHPSWYVSARKKQLYSSEPSQSV